VPPFEKYGANAEGYHMRSRPGGSAARLFRSRSDCRSGHRLTVPAARVRGRRLLGFVATGCSRSWRRAARVRGDGLLAFEATGCFWSVERLLARHIRARVRPIGVVRWAAPLSV